jgi:riboflavin synthase
MIRGPVWQAEPRLSWYAQDMFTGLIETTGTVLALRPTRGALRMIVAAPSLAGRWGLGDSIAVNGVCLTAVEMEALDEPHPGRFAADLAEETIRRTTLEQLKPGALVNLELPRLAGTPLGGHVVQGHVDGVGRIAAIVPLHEDLERTDWRMSIDVPVELAAGVVPQGSITVDGISLTVARVIDELPERFQVEIAVIPHTYRGTNLHSLLAGSAVNLETDVLAKYAAQQAAARPAVQQGEPRTVVAHAKSGHAAVHGKPEWLTVEYLLANGY